MRLQEAITGISLNGISQDLFFNFTATFCTLICKRVGDTWCYSHALDLLAAVMKYSKVKHWYNKHTILRCIKL